MSRFAIKQIVKYHRVKLLALDRNAERTKEEDIKLHILSHLRNLLVLEQRAQNRGIVALNLVAVALVCAVAKWDIPRLVRLYRQREANNSVAKDVEARGLNIKAEAVVLSHLGNNLAQALRREYGRIFVWRSRRCGKCG